MRYTYLTRTSSLHRIQLCIAKANRQQQNFSILLILFHVQSYVVTRTVVTWRASSSFTRYKFLFIPRTNFFFVRTMSRSVKTPNFRDVSRERRDSGDGFSPSFSVSADSLEKGVMTVADSRFCNALRVKHSRIYLRRYIVKLLH